MTDDVTVDGLHLRDTVIAKWVELDDTPTSTIMAAVAVREILQQLHKFAVQEGSGVVSEYELREFQRPLTRFIRETKGVAGD